MVAASELDDAIRRFAEEVLGLLDGAGILDTNLHRLWRDVEGARQDSVAARLRRLGFDPDEIPDADVHVAAAANDFGADSVEELVADAGWRGVTTLPSVKELAAAAKQAGSAMRVQDAVRLHANVLRNNERHRHDAPVDW